MVKIVQTNKAYEKTASAVVVVMNAKNMRAWKPDSSGHLKKSSLLKLETLNGKQSWF